MQVSLSTQEHTVRRAKKQGVESAFTGKVPSVDGLSVEKKKVKEGPHQPIRKEERGAKIHFIDNHTGFPVFYDAVLVVPVFQKKGQDQTLINKEKFLVGSLVGADTADPGLFKQEKIKLQMDQIPFFHTVIADDANRGKGGIDPLKQIPGKPFPNALHR
ncbi:MAG: hypothetical protein KDI06_06305 [Calditrichaeota bacterium]|nr:hypothetical protein [Calditrichota bacterium]